jgi:uncharacterized protein
MIADLPIWWLAPAFFTVALLYASVGFGGGSSYTAILALGGCPAAHIPILSLSCNLAVAGGGTVVFSGRGLLRSRLVGPFVLPAIPAAYLGGRLPIPPEVYLVLLGLSLGGAGLALLLRRPSADQETRPCPALTAAAIGVGLGAVSGIVGIGGGVFLAPILLLKRWADPRESAACASVFITLNSLAGLAGQVSKSGIGEFLDTLPPLLLAVLAGGQIGSRLGAGLLAARRVRQGTAVIILVIATRILWSNL